MLMTLFNTLRCHYVACFVTLLINLYVHSTCYKFKVKSPCKANEKIHSACRAISFILLLEGFTFYLFAKQVSFEITQLQALTRKLIDGNFKFANKRYHYQ
jgi:hypothetical protein